MQNELGRYDFVLVNNITNFSKAKELFIEYSESLKIDLCFQDFENELKELHIQYKKPLGGIFLIRDLLSDKFIGCVGIRKFENKIAELKRMYIKEGHRNQGLGEQLLNLAVNLAKDLNYERLWLDTLEFMKPAIKLYRAKGFKEIEAYRYNPRTDVIYFELYLK